MIRKELIVENESGFHVRVASMVCKEALKYISSLTLTKNGATADCKSCLDLLTLMAPKGTILTLSVDGDDEEQAFAAVVDLFDKKFYED